MREAEVLARLRWLVRVLIGLAVVGLPLTAHAFFEDVCVSTKDHTIVECIEPSSECMIKPSAGKACLAQSAQSLRMLVEHLPGRSTIHADATYFIAQALGYRSDVAYWIAAYNEVTDLTRYAPFDQCGGEATAENSGKKFITAKFNGFERTNLKTDGPLYHYVISYSPNGDGTDVHGAGGVQAVYPLHYPLPGYPGHLDSIYQGTLFNLRQWAMQPSDEPGLLCAAGLTVPNGRSNFNGSSCLNGVSIKGTVPLLETFGFGSTIKAHSGPKVLDNSQGEVTYEVLGAWLQDQTRTIGTLWKDPQTPPVPVQIARIGIYLHSLQDAASHSTYCGDDAPSRPGGEDPGTYMAMGPNGVRLVFGKSCASGPHLAGHIEETGTGSSPLPLRDYTALNATLEELVWFGNRVARGRGWIANPQLLPPDLDGGKNGQGRSTADLEAQLVGPIVKGQAWTRGEVYRSGMVTEPLQQVKALDRLHAMNRALAEYDAMVRKQSTRGASLVALEPMPGNSSDPKDTSACFK